MKHQHRQVSTYDELKSDAVRRILTEPPFQHRLVLRPVGHRRSAKTVVSTVMAAVVADASSK